MNERYKIYNRRFSSYVTSSLLASSSLSDAVFFNTQAEAEMFIVERFTKIMYSGDMIAMGHSDFEVHREVIQHQVVSMKSGTEIYRNIDDMYLRHLVDNPEIEKFNPSDKERIRCIIYNVGRHGFSLVSDKMRTFLSTHPACRAIGMENGVPPCVLDNPELFMTDGTASKDPEIISTLVLLSTDEEIVRYNLRPL